MNSEALEHDEASQTGFTADDVYKAIADGLVTFDLLAEPLSNSNRSRAYRDMSTPEFTRRLEAEEIAQDELQLTADRIASIQPGDIISYDGKDYTVTLVGTENVTLAHESGATEVSVSTLENLYRTEQIRITHAASTTGGTIDVVQVGAYSPELVHDGSARHREASWTFA